MASDADFKSPAGAYPPHQDLPPYTQDKLTRHYASLAELLPAEYQKDRVGIINSVTAECVQVMRRTRLISRWLERIEETAASGERVDIARLNRELLLDDARRRYQRGDWVDPKRRRIYAVCFGDPIKRS